MPSTLANKRRARGPVYSSLIVCDACDRVLSIGEYIEKFCSACEADKARQRDAASAAGGAA